MQMWRAADALIPVTCVEHSAQSYPIWAAATVKKASKVVCPSVSTHLMK
jgi:hypothetical protein